MYLYIYLYIRHWPKTPPAVQYWGSCWRHSLSGPFRPRVFVEDLFVPGLRAGFLEVGLIFSDHLIFQPDLCAQNNIFIPLALRWPTTEHTGSAVADNRGLGGLDLQFTILWGFLR